MSKKERQIPSATVLKGMVEHVTYERVMWAWGWDQVLMNHQEQNRKNAAIEIYLLHSRNLAEFFISDPNRNDDVVASDYVPGWQIDSAVKDLRASLSATNKRQGHISIYRLDEGQEKRDRQRWIDGASHIEATWGRFRRELSPTRRTWFDACP